MTGRGGTRERWAQLDAFRGVAVIGMLLVNNPGSEDAVYAQLRHSAWHGCTLADLVFPFFLFVVGVTTALSGTSSSARIWRRAAIIFGLGLLLNWFPFYQSGDIPWTTQPGMLDRMGMRLLLLRIPGVLQRIAITYGIAALLQRVASTRALVTIVVALLLGYWAMLTVVPVPGEGVRGALLLGDPARVLPAHVDRALFDWSAWGLGNHLWDSARTWDPEGVLSTAGALATVLLGLVAGRYALKRGPEHATKAFLLAGLSLLALGALWAMVLPLNKALWTSSFVLVSGGVALIGLATFALLPSTREAWDWRAPLLTFGANPLIAYVGSEIMRRILHSSIKIPSPAGRLGTDEWVTRFFERAGMSAPAASLAWAALFVVAWWWVLRTLRARAILVRA